MLRCQTVIVLGLMALSLGACAQHAYLPGPGMSTANLGPDQARCRLFARGTRPGVSFGASGSSKYVAIATAAVLVGAAVGNAVHDNLTYDDCMQAIGWQVADGGNPGANAAPTDPAVNDGAPQIQPSPEQLARQRALEAALTPMNELSQFSMDPERATRMANAQRAAEVWLTAQQILNGPDSDRRKRALNAELCDAGDQSACVMALALARSTR